MQPRGSVTQWIGRLKETADPAAHQQLWDRYFNQLLVVARKRLRNAPKRAKDEEDVALNAMDSFFRRAQNGQFRDLHDRTDLWRLLVKITARKASNQARDELAVKRGGGFVFGESEALGSGASDDRPTILDIAAPEPTPEFTVEVIENCKTLLAKLDAPQRRIVELRLEGLSNQEISQELGYSLRTVERRLSTIRELWQHDLA